MTDSREIYSVYDLKEAVGEEVFKETVLEVLENEHYLRPNFDGLRVIDYPWDYQDTESLEERVGEILAGLNKGYNGPRYLHSSDVREVVLRGNAEAVRQAKERGVEIDRVYGILELSCGYFDAIESKWHDGWVAEAETEALRDVTDDLNTAFCKKLDLDGLNLCMSEWIDELNNEYKVVFNDGTEDHLSGLTFEVNIIIGIGDEWNTEHTNLPYLNEHMTELLDEGIDEEDLEGGFSFEAQEAIENNGATWLLYTQGYTLSDAFASGKESKFLDSFREEYANLTSYMGAVTFCVKVGFDDFCELAAENGANFEIDPNRRGFREYVTVGFFDACQGGGSTLDIQLEKPVVINSSVIYDLQVEGVGNSHGYTVNEVYGLVDEAWASCVAHTDKPLMATPEIDYAQLAKDINTQHNLLECKSIDGMSACAEGCLETENATEIDKSNVDFDR